MTSIYHGISSGMTKAYIILFLIAGASLVSCSAIGYGIGSLMDNGGSKDTTGSFTKPIFRDLNSNRDRAARIQYDNSKSGFGIFNSYSDEPDSSYTKRYAGFAVNHTIEKNAIPLNENIEISDQYNNHYFGRFHGYSPKGLEIQNDEKIVNYDINHITSLIVVKTSLRLSDSVLISFFENNSVPIRSTMKFQNGKGIFTVTNSDFQNVLFTDRGNARWYGLAIGALIDIYFGGLLLTNRFY